MVEKNSERKITSTEKCAKNESTTMLNDQTIELCYVRNRLETFEATVLCDVKKRLSGMIDEVMQELRTHELQTNEFRNFATTQIQRDPNRSHNSNTRNNPIKSTDAPKTKNTSENGTKTEANKYNIERNSAADNGFANLSSDKGENIKRKSPNKHQVLSKKVFVMRESFLTALLEVDHMKTIYHIFYIIFLFFLLHNISYEYFVKGSITFGLETFKASFAHIHQVAGIWLLQHVFVFGIYYALKVWSNIRNTLAKHKTLQQCWSISCLSVYIATQIIFAYVPTLICLHLNPPFITASVLLLESVRLLMKMHSFVRTIIPRVLAGKLKTEEGTTKEVNFPRFNKYLYFLFAPVCLYRDEYPRTSTIRWKFALSRFLEVVAVAFLYSTIYERHITYNFENFGKEEISIASIILKQFNMLLSGIIIFLSGFYLILHSWLNFTAELLRFGDRMFYRDWWTASNFETYYRNWNVVIHDWLYEYIYKDCYNYVFKGSKTLSSLTVFIISALFHEYILGCALQVVFPVMFVFFGVIGVAMVFLTRYASKNLGNLLLWSSLMYGSSMMISLYSIEYFTRLNCPKELNEWTDHLVPHVWSCYFK